LAESSCELHTLIFNKNKTLAIHKLLAGALVVNTYFTQKNFSRDNGAVENRIGLLK